MSETATINIAMVGPRGVGKTSLLAAMYNELDDELSKIGCNLSLGAGATTKNITDRLKELKKAATSSGIKVQADEGVVGGGALIEHKFDLDIGDGGAPEVTLRFLDMPGAWYTGEGSRKDLEDADRTLGESHVSFLAVDATALMEAPSKQTGGMGKYHDHFNKPEAIRQAYKRALNNFGDDHLVVITLIRAETYVKSGRINDLYKRLREAYGNLASCLQKNGKQIPVFGCYVETVGSLVFNSFIEKEAEKDGVVISEFRRIPGKGYAPSRCAIPLRLAVSKGLMEAVSHAGKKVDLKDTFLNNIADWFGISTELTEARIKLERSCRVFQEIQGRLNDDDFIVLSK